jgi:chromosome segregation ATPase
MISEKRAYGEGRNRGATVSYGEIERAAREIMANGGRPTVEGVYKALGRGSPNHISVEMQKFWKNQGALNGGDPLALTRLPPELADAALAQWEQALRLAHQNASHDDNAARAHLEQLRRDTDARVHSVELREKEWDMAARVRERALADTREQVNVLMKELAADRAELRARDAHIAELEYQLEEHRRQLATVIARAIAKNRALAKKRPRRQVPLKPKKRVTPKKRVRSKRTPHRRVKRKKSHGQRQ